MQEVVFAVFSAKAYAGIGVPEGRETDALDPQERLNVVFDAPTSTSPTSTSPSSASGNGVGWWETPTPRWLWPRPGRRAPSRRRTTGRGRPGLRARARRSGATRRPR